MKRTAVILGMVGLIFASSLSAFAQTDTKQTRANRAQTKNAAFAEVTDNPSLPRVLLIGDSISIGYTTSVQKMLKGKANVHRIPTNGGPTIKGLDSLTEWLGDGKWDIIHFNWGLHDLKYMEGKHQVGLEEYRQNLETLVKQMKKTGATLIWCSTTPVPEGVSPPRTNKDVEAYNQAALKIMKKHDVLIDDLYTYALPQLSEIQRPNNVHFSPEGSAVLAEQVADSIMKVIRDRRPR
ncbi:Acyl-CoA thioesterase-1 [Planctomycetales bacterium 10988]|nr:Acyl-CoA thioesterase-1 [Planctomycetales bacterium 10988]